MREDQYLFGVYLDRHPLFKRVLDVYSGKSRKIIIQHTQPHHDGYAAAVEKIKTIEKKLKELD